MMTARTGRFLMACGLAAMFFGCPSGLGKIFLRIKDGACNAKQVGRFSALPQHIAVWTVTNTCFDGQAHTVKIYAFTEPPDTTPLPFYCFDGLSTSTGSVSVSFTKVDYRLKWAACRIDRSAGSNVKYSVQVDSQPPQDPEIEVRDPGPIIRGSPSPWPTPPSN
jgi:hypothetical protein